MAITVLVLLTLPSLGISKDQLPLSEAKILNSAPTVSCHLCFIFVSLPSYLRNASYLNQISYFKENGCCLVSYKKQLCILANYFQFNVKTCLDFVTGEKFTFHMFCL